ncbi:hypothetical protein [Solilutibacter silvestris]|uniref:hypothetical protein n=1 Tax=Solilutibacter silvestris TaxID=1645665 RepID=UPI003D351F7E
MATPRPASATPTHVQVDEDVRGIVAGAVMVALTERLHDTALRIRLKSVEVKSREGAAQNLEGIGEYRPAAQNEWTSFRFSTRYVPGEGSATYPVLDFGQSASTPLRVLNDPVLIGELETRVCDQIAKDSGVREVRLQFDDIQTERNPGGGLDISADARADVGVDTGRRTHIEGSYDERARRWINVNYLFNIPDRLTGGR